MAKVNVIAEGRNSLIHLQQAHPELKEFALVQVPLHSKMENFTYLPQILTQVLRSYRLETSAQWVLVYQGVDGPVMGDDTAIMHEALNHIMKTLGLKNPVEVTNRYFDLGVNLGHVVFQWGANAAGARYLVGVSPVIYNRIFVLPIPQRRHTWVNIENYNDPLVYLYVSIHVHGPDTPAKKNPAWTPNVYVQTKNRAVIGKPHPTGSRTMQLREAITHVSFLIESPQLDFNPPHKPAPAYAENANGLWFQEHGPERQPLDNPRWFQVDMHGRMYDVDGNRVNP